MLRHYRRGGVLRGLLGDRFLWQGGFRTRAFREWALLAELCSRGLPVPEPVAAGWCRQGMVYRADLITRRLAGVSAWSDLLLSGACEARDWRAVGYSIGRFHAQGVWHADLNAHNIQLDRSGRVFLLDFDRSRLRPPAAGWQQANLARLARSLDKLRRQAAAGIGRSHWPELLAGYSRGQNVRPGPQR